MWSLRPGEAATCGPRTSLRHRAAPGAGLSSHDCRRRFPGGRFLRTGILRARAFPRSPDAARPRGPAPRPPRVPASRCSCGTATGPEADGSRVLGGCRRGPGGTPNLTPPRPAPGARHLPDRSGSSAVCRASAGAESERRRRRYPHGDGQRRLASTRSRRPPRAARCLAQPKAARSAPSCSAGAFRTPAPAAEEKKSALPSAEVGGRGPCAAVPAGRASPLLPARGRGFAFAPGARGLTRQRK